MTSEKKAEANRRNALKNTGPKTPEGKAAVRLNALKHRPPLGGDSLAGRGRGSAEGAGRISEGRASAGWRVGEPPDRSGGRRLLEAPACRQARGRHLRRGSRHLQTGAGDSPRAWSNLLPRDHEGRDAFSELSRYESRHGAQPAQRQPPHELANVPRLARHEG